MRIRDWSSDVCSSDLQGPDVMMVRAYGAFQAVAEPGYLMALDQSTVPELKNFPADALAAETLPSDGKVYAVPFAQQSMMVLYNKEIFEIGRATCRESVVK